MTSPYREPGAELQTRFVPKPVETEHASLLWWIRGMTCEYPALLCKRTCLNESRCPFDENRED